MSKAITTCQENKYLSSKGIGSSGLVQDQNHYFGLGPKYQNRNTNLADTFGQNCNRYQKSKPHFKGRI